MTELPEQANARPHCAKFFPPLFAPPPKELQRRNKQRTGPRPDREDAQMPQEGSHSARGA